VYEIKFSRKACYDNQVLGGTCSTCTAAVVRSAIYGHDILEVREWMPLLRWSYEISNDLESEERIASTIRTQIYYIPWDHRFIVGPVRSQAGAGAGEMSPSS
jgi:hypothetical protein